MSNEKNLEEKVAVAITVSSREKDSMNLKIHDALPYKPDWKSTIERFFQIANQKFLTKIMDYPVHQSDHVEF
jgi:hypothetical protein